MGRQWDADVQLRDDDAARLLEGQFPDLAPARLVPLGVGWDNVAYVVNERFVFRFPRRAIAAGLLATEARVLPLLAPHLPLPIPSPTYLGAPTADYPYVFAGYPLIPGRTACDCACTDEERAALAPALGRFLAALHGIPLDAATLAWAPRDDIWRADVRGRAPRVKERLAANPAGLPAGEVAALLALVDDLAADPGDISRTDWVHGDFYGRHLLLDDERRAAGVIDWGDVHAGDRAIDLSIAFSFLPPGARPAFRAAYGAIDAATWRRARFRAIHYGATLTEYGTEAGDPTIRALGLDALRFAPVGA